jgi:hypothetical protein
MESLQEILMDAYREGREDEVKTALEKRREVKKTGSARGVWQTIGSVKVLLRKPPRKTCRRLLVSSGP